MNIIFQIGYWEDYKSQDTTYMHPKYLVCQNWASDFKKELINYLQSGKTLISFGGYSYCRFSDGPEDNKMGSSDLTDGFWVWPEGLAVYIEKFDVMLPENFVEYARQHHFNIPGNLNIEKMENDLLKGKLIYNKQFWIDWCNSILRDKSKVDINNYSSGKEVSSRYIYRSKIKRFLRII